MWESCGVLDTGPEKLVEAAVLVGFLHGLVTFDTSAWHFFGDFSLPATLRKIVREIEGWWSTGLQTHTHTLRPISVCHCVNYLHSRSVSHWCLAVSLCQSFVLCWRKRRAAASKYEWLESSDLNVSTHKHGHSLENNMVCIHTCTESTLCNSVGSAGFVDSICSAPRHLPFAPHPLWQVEGIQTQKLRRHTLNSTDTWLVFRLHTHTHIYTPAVVQSYSAPWCQAGWAVRRVFIPPALRPNRGWGIRPDSPQKNSNIQ